MSPRTNNAGASGAERRAEKAATKNPTPISASTRFEQVDDLDVKIGNVEIMTDPEIGFL